MLSELSKGELFDFRNYKNPKTLKVGKINSASFIKKVLGGVVAGFGMAIWAGVPFNTNVSFFPLKIRA